MRNRAPRMSGVRIDEEFGLQLVATASLPERIDEDDIGVVC
jgi:hypothetical protein